MKETEKKERKLISDILFFIFIFLIVGMIVVFQNNIDDGTDVKLVGVHIKGEVNAPGYYELEYGSRVKDALDVSGNETTLADLSDINLARKLSDGDEIVIPKKGGDEEKDDGVININTADMYTLCKLDGIGETLALNIISYRKDKGQFKSIDELKKVDGIGNSKFNALKNKISVK